MTNSSNYVAHSASSPGAKVVTAKTILWSAFTAHNAEHQQRSHRDGVGQRGDRRFCKPRKPDSHSQYHSQRRKPGLLPVPQKHIHYPGKRASCSRSFRQRSWCSRPNRSHNHCRPYRGLRQRRNRDRAVAAAPTSPAPTAVACAIVTGSGSGCTGNGCSGHGCTSNGVIAEIGTDTIGATHRAAMNASNRAGRERTADDCLGV